MPNGKAFIEELREMLEEEKTLPQKQVSRLMLTSQLELYNKIDELTKKVDGELKNLKKNPLVAIGEFMCIHPKSFAGILVFLLLLSNIWFIDEIRYTVLVWLKIPEEIIGLLVHHGG